MDFWAVSNFFPITNGAVVHVLAQAKCRDTGTGFYGHKDL